MPPAPVAGVAMGLVMNEETGKWAVLSDIAGAEDHYGEGTSPKYPGAGDAFASSKPGYGDRDRGPRRDRDRGPQR